MVKLASSGVLVLALIFFIQPSFSQPADREIVDQPTEWFAINSNTKLHPHYGIAFDSQLRFVEDLQSMQHYIRAGFEVYITPKLSVVPGGYMYVWNYLYGKQPTQFENDEFRIWQQGIYKNSSGRFHFHHRLRLEERLIESRSLVNNKIVYNGFSQFLFRTRYRFQVNIGLNKQKLERGALYLNIWDEVFYGWGHNDTFNEIDQNRISLALGYQFSPKFSVTAGGLFQLMIKNNGTKQENNIGSIVQFNYNFDLTKKEAN